MGAARPPATRRAQGARRIHARGPVMRAETRGFPALQPSKPGWRRSPCRLPSDNMPTKAAAGEKKQQWSKIHGRTVDLTSFRHPGGNIIEFFYNMDGTSAFEQFHGHSPKATVPRPHFHEPSRVQHTKTEPLRSPAGPHARPRACSRPGRAGHGRLLRRSAAEAWRPVRRPVRRRARRRGGPAAILSRGGPVRKCWRALPAGTRRRARARPPRALWPRGELSSGAALRAERRS